MKFNPLSKIFWKWQAKQKLEHKDETLQYNAIQLLGELGTFKDFGKLVDFLEDNRQLIRNAASHAIKLIFRNTEEESDKKVLYQLII